MNRTEMTRILRLLLATFLLAFLAPSIAHARWYDPEDGRWTAKDPLAPVGLDRGDGQNLYEYSQSKPRSRLDPSGLASEDCCICEVKPGSCRIDVFISRRRLFVSERPQMLAQLFTEIKLSTVSGNDADVAGCHLRQDTHGFANHDTAISSTNPGTRILNAYPDYEEWETLRDYSSSTTAGQSNYDGASFRDGPGITDSFNPADGPTNIRTIWWQAHVFVEEAPQVQTWWGYQFTALNPNANPSTPRGEWYGSTFWAGRRYSPFSISPPYVKPLSFGTDPILMGPEL